MGSRDRDHAQFSEIFVRGHVGTIPGNMPAKFEVPTFSRFGADRQTDGNRPIRDDRVVNGDHAHFPDIRHTTYDTQTILESSNVLLTQCIGQTKMYMYHRGVEVK